MESTSASLLERLRRPGDSVAWNRFVHLYSPLLYAWAVRCGLRDADAAEFVQEVFAILVDRLPSFQYDPSRSFRAWLKTVAMNQWRARQRRAHAVPLEGQPEPSEPDPLESFWDTEYRRWLTRRALQVMKSHFEPHVWRACWLTAAEGWPAKRVAAELDMSIGAVYAARSRVLARVRQELQDLDT